MTTNDERRIKILEFVLERQKAKQNTTKNTVIKYMIENKLSSRQTTHNLIKELINEGKLNKQEINSQIHFLTLDEKLDSDKMREELLKSQIEKELELFPDVLQNKVIMIEGKPTSKGAATPASKSTGYIVKSKSPRYIIKFKHKRRAKTVKEDEGKDHVSY